MYVLIWQIFFILFCSVINIRNTAFIKTFGRNLIRLRREKGLSQEQLAHKADIPINQVGRIERGEINTTLSTLYMLAFALDLNVSELFDFEYEKPEK